MMRLLKICLLLTLLGGGTWLGLERIETKAVYPFDPTHKTPAQAGLTSVRERQLNTQDQMLIVWTSPPKNGKPTILYFHGNAGNLANRAGRFKRFVDRGYGVIAPAYRGSSGSTGRPTEASLSHDARFIYLNAAQLIPGLNAQNIVVYGESLGTGVALKMIADTDTPAPAGVVLEAPYTQVPDVVRHNYPKLTPIIPKMQNIWNSLFHVKSVTAPMLILHGTDDVLIPITMGQEIFSASPSKSKKIVKVSGAGHNDVWRSDSLPKLWRFIDGL